jgi:high-affinity iron transporter
MFANFLIGLREGLEASLVVGILVAYLVRTDHRRQLPALWFGVGAAVAISLATGAIMTFTANALSFKAKEAFGGVLSLIAVVFVTGMIFWMRRQSRHLKGELQGKLEGAMAGGATGLALVSFLAVGREGLETALFVWSAVQAAGAGAGPVVGAFLGLIVAAMIGWLIYRRSVSLNLAVFFRVTGAALIVVVAGILDYGIHDLQESGVLPGLHALAFDVSRQIPPSSWYGTLLKGIFNFSPAFTWLQLIAYVGYVVPVMTLFFRPPSPAVAPSVAGARDSSATAVAR